MIWNKIQDKSPRDKEVVIVWDGSSFEFCKYLNGKFILRDANKPTELSSSYRTREDITNIVELWAELEKPKDKSNCGDGKPKRTGLSSLVGKLSKQGGREMMRQVAEIRAECARPSGAEGFTKLTFNVSEIMNSVSGIIKSWIEVHLRLTGLGRHTHPAVIMAAGYTLEREVRRVPSPIITDASECRPVRLKEETWTLLRHNERLDSIKIYVTKW